MDGDLRRSIEPDDSATVAGPGGALVHERGRAQSERLVRRLHEVIPGKAWSLVGNGLSNQSFVLAPEGIICIDSGESREEMAAALAELRAVCDAPLAAVLLTHFHYVGGTLAAFEEAGRELPVFGHEDIPANLVRAGGLIAPTYLRGLVEQFAIYLPEEGPSSVDNVGLGRRYREPVHAPHSPGYVAPSSTFSGPTTLSVAGLEVVVDPAPSDAEDSVTYWFPALGLAVHNLIWPVLFNVFAIRGEEYRDPRVLVAGIDRLLALKPSYLIATHGPPMSGPEEIQHRGGAARDAVQYLWDQTVRLANSGLTAKGIAERLQLPEAYADDHLTQELYGLVEHHVRQVRSGLFGFFDGDYAELLPLPEVDRRERLIAGFGGREVVAAKLHEALEAEDLRWALELGSWLVGTPQASEAERRAMAEALRRVARRTSAANITSWCLTHAMELEGDLDLSGLRRSRLSPHTVAMAPLEATIEQLRVLLDPKAVDGLDLRVAFSCDGEHAGMHLRRGVLVPVAAGGSFDLEVACSKSSLATLLTGPPGDAATLLDGDDFELRGSTDGLVKLLRALDR